MGDEAERILDEIISFEKRVKKCIDEDPKKYEAQVKSSRSTLKYLYKDIILKHSLFLYNDNKELDGSLWKTCFYKPIEEYRGKIRKYNLHIVTATQHEQDGRPYPYTVQQLQARVTSLMSSLTSFLSEGMVYYQLLVAEIESSIAPLRSSDTNNCDGLVAFQRRCIYRCLLYLGDLARYKEMYANTSTRNYVEAMTYYGRAAMLTPTAGNAQNQVC
jgi:hypothetical protein